MIKNIGVEIDLEIYKTLNNIKLTGFLTTFSDKGIPMSTIVTTLIFKNRESLLLAIMNDTITYKNIVWQKKIMLSFYESNNLILSIIGRAGVLKAPSNTHPMMHIIQIDLIDFFNESPMLISIESGIKWRYISNDAKKLHDALIKELHEYAKS